MTKDTDPDLIRLYAAYRKLDPEEPLDRNPHLAWNDVLAEHRKICAEREAKLTAALKRMLDGYLPQIAENCDCWECVPAREVMAVLRKYGTKAELASPDKFVSKSCQGESCSICGAPATRKVGEEILHDDPMPARHNLTAYVCDEHFRAIFSPRWHLNEADSAAFIATIENPPDATDALTAAAARYKSNHAEDE